ncbi:sensor histidine kinase [Rhodoplanes sp. Z2-YC6860]|uniref:sensor histidine kinase n=1 Tax=Rhodoplanes sp. Z2-YC6860 TaxID=674703 RepID=UPI00078D2C13|nr:sensor histidine kinase [Rhodoplanes sp. Z2-YC6860]AMN41407.1 signal transduction histidine kinase [Rhodoplanes sp. Z2-YC6860]
MRANSLALRLFLSATVWTTLILLVTGFALSGLYRNSVERGFDRRIGVYLKTLIADLASPDIPIEKTGQMLGEPLFELPLSGWYWQVTRLDRTKPEITSSRSLWDRTLPHVEPQAVPEPDGARKAYVQGPEDQRLRLVERDVDLGDDGRFLVAVAGDAAELDDEITAFNWAIATTFMLLAAVLLLTTLFQVRFGLAPLVRISRGLAAIRSGTAEKLEGRFPVEIEPLARETNALLDSNREIVERARTHVGNLAHALKTPLSVMMNEAAARPDDPLAGKVSEQIGIMRDQVTRHLERARIAARVAVVGTITDVVPVVQAVARTIEKTQRDKDLEIAIDVQGEARFRGERQDLEEMVGNLVDNAGKWASSRVSIEVLLERPEPSRQAVRIVVDDDGPGLSPAQREQVARRGQRLDESKPGSGLGLSIVVELARLYGGALNLGTAPIGGLRAELVLPAG